MKIVLIIIFVITTGFLLTVPSTSTATHLCANDSSPDPVDNHPCTGTAAPRGPAVLEDPTGAGTIEELLKKIVDWMAVIATPIATGMIIFGAFQMLFAGGSPEKFNAGKRTILYTVVGYAIILIGWGFTSIITELLSSA